MTSHTVRPEFRAPEAAAAVILGAGGAGGPLPSDPVRAAARCVSKLGQKVLQQLFGQLYTSPTAR